MFPKTSTGTGLSGSSLAGVNLGEQPYECISRRRATLTWTTRPWRSCRGDPSMLTLDERSANRGQPTGANPETWTNRATLTGAM